MSTARGRGNPSNYPKIEKSPISTIADERGARRDVFGGNILGIDGG